jgi:hypothetical protein
MPENQKTPKIAPSKKPARSLTHTEWLAEIKDNVDTAINAGQPVGACLVPNAQTGENDCVLMDQTSCTQVGGTFIGGPCGGL